MAARTPYIALNDTNFEGEVLESAGLVLVAFWADWCGPCHIMAPVIEHVATTFVERVKVGRLDIDRHPYISRLYGVRLVPTLLFFMQGEVVDHVLGLISTRDLMDKLHALLDTQGD